MTGTRQHVLVLDFGSQYTQLIARKVRELGVYAEIVAYDCPVDEIRARAPVALILSGGPSSIYADGVPRADREVFELGIPVLGLCYGLQNIVYSLGGRVNPSTEREYGPAFIKIIEKKPLFGGVADGSRVWMSHGDRVDELPDGLVALAMTEASPYAAIGDRKRRIYGLQFHPEVAHTEYGKQILANFVLGVAEAGADWTMGAFVAEQVESIRDRVGDDGVVLGLSGGVDSGVLAVLLHKALGGRFHAVFVDHGLLRLGEAEEVVATFRDELGMDIRPVDAGELFLSRLEGIEDPEEKRRIIGRTFIEVFAGEAKKLAKKETIKFLAQGTLYPDRIESRGIKGPSDTIKTHHNVGGLPDELPFELLEPFGELFKDEVRQVGRELGVPERVIGRHPFPGPGLAVRCLGEVTPEKLEMLRRADAIAVEEIRAAGVYDDIAQALVVLLPVKSVGVMGDERTYEYTAALRCVTTDDFMTADWYRMDPDLLARISTRVVGEVRGINRLVYDITSKPPATVEWE
ncbi:MAG: glutamine-hydrolyzing GMP synthase [Candidatus Coatesbacteria bacterium]|nr:MAG: glutamine-hydrolyzing GMP synthase [Candidatus Coatesbacteria bacterium]